MTNTEKNEALAMQNIISNVIYRENEKSLNKYGRVMTNETEYLSTRIAIELARKNFGNLKPYQDDIEGLCMDLTAEHSINESIKLDTVKEVIKKILEDSVSNVSVDYIKDIAKEYGVIIDD